MTFDSPSLPPDDFGVGGPEFRAPEFYQRPIQEDLRVPWGFSDLAVFVVLAIAAVFVVGFLMLPVFRVFGVTRSMILRSTEDQILFSIIVQAIVDCALLGYLALQTRLAFRLPFWRTFRWRKIETQSVPSAVAYAVLIVSGMVISVLVEAASSLHPPKGPVPIDSIYQDRLSALLFLLMAVLLAPLVEETIFRGYLYPVVARSWGIAAGIVTAGSLFGLLHGFQLGGAWWQIGLLVIVGIIFTWVRAATRTVAASYCMHLGYNSFLLVGFLASTHFLKVLPAIH